MSKITKNIFANYLGVVITTALSFLVVPFYLKILGKDSFGLIGIASLIQGWVMLLNSGLAPVTGREAAKAYAIGNSWREAAIFFRTVDVFLISLSLIVFVIFYISRGWLSNVWIESSSLNSSTISLALCLLIAMTSIRLLTSITRGILANIDRQIWLNNNLIIFSLLRFAASIPLLYAYPGINYLFIWWLFVSLLEYFSIQYKTWSIIPVKVNFFIFDFLSIKKRWKMIVALASTSLIWVLITNTDKLILSTYLSLESYGFYSIATLLSSSIIILAQPIAQAFQPKMTSAFTHGGIENAEMILREATKWIVYLIYPIVVILCLYPNQIIFVWTGDSDAMQQAGDFLIGYTIGNIFIALGSILYAFQVSIGIVRKHLQGNIILCVCYLPLIPFIVTKYGAIGISILWAIVNFIYFVLWNLHLLKKITKTLYPQWVLIETLLPLIMLFLIMTFVRYFSF